MYACTVRAICAEVQVRCSKLSQARMLIMGLGAGQAFERRLWQHQHALRQFEHTLTPELLAKLEDRGLDLERLQVRAICQAHTLRPCNNWKLCAVTCAVNTWLRPCSRGGKGLR